MSTAPGALNEAQLINRSSDLNEVSRAPIAHAEALDPSTDEVDHELLIDTSVRSMDNSDSCD